MSEQGEIVELDDGDFEVYVPVERPRVEERRWRALPSEESCEGGGGGSSEDEHLPPPLPKAQPPMKKKYNVWCSEPDVLSESLLDIGVAPSLKERSVESYNYRLKFPRNHTDESSEDEPEPNMDGEKEEARRRRKGMALRTRKNSKSLLLVPKLLRELSSTAEDSPETVAQDITGSLQEPNEDLVRVVVKVLGPAKAIDLYRKTKEIEKEGGMLILNQSRRRTSGGIFFFLLRGDYEVSSEQLRDIFDGQKAISSTKVRRRRKKRTKPTVDSLEEGEIVQRDELLFSSGCDQRRLSQSPERPPLDNPPPSPATDIEPSLVKSDITEDDQMDL